MNRLEAAAAGERFYTARKPCKRDGDTQRYTAAAQCVTCSKRRSAEVAAKVAGLIKGAKA